MESQEFTRVAERFSNATVDGKIDIYISTEGLSQAQYKELLKMFPLNELHRLEEALA